MGKPVQIQVLAEFPCSRCPDGKARQLTVAPLTPDGRVDMQHECESFGDLVCPSCREKQQDEVKAANREHQRRKRWQSKAKSGGMKLAR